MTRYGLSLTSNDRFPIHFKPDSEHTIQGESLVDVIQRLTKAGYVLYNDFTSLEIELQKRGLKKENMYQEVNKTEGNK